VVWSPFRPNVLPVHVALQPPTSQEIMRSGNPETWRCFHSILPDIRISPYWTARQSPTRNTLFRTNYMVFIPKFRSSPSQKPVVKYPDCFIILQSVYQIFKPRNSSVNIYKTANLWGFPLKNAACFNFLCRPNCPPNTPSYRSGWHVRRVKAAPVRK
jgi:hypothetical protein